MSGHLLWNASLITAEYLESHAAELVKDKTVLEFGAGAGLPSLVCAVNGAAKVVVTDYPDEELIRNLRYNIEHSAATEGARLENIVEEGYLWGNAPTDLIKHLPAGEGGSAQAEGFDVLILADLLFNHSEHRKLVVSLQKTMKRTQEARALVFFTPHRPWLFERDMAFFELAREVGFVVEKVLERRMEEAVLARGPVRRSIHEVDGEEDMEWKKLVLGYELRWKEV